MPGSYKFAICNELFQNTPLAQQCSEVRKLGYTGFEIAPFTLDADPVSLTSARRAQVRSMISNEGLQFVGLHWLLMAPPGLHVTSHDADVLRKSWRYVAGLIDLCADLSGPTDRPVVVFGSPKQRTSTPESNAEEATKRFIDGMAQAAPHAEARGVTLLVEALSPSQTDVVTSLDEAVKIVKQIGSPAVQTMFDVHNAIDETAPHGDLIRRYAPYIRHVHVNEMDGREPGMGDYDFAALLRTLDEIDYAGWVSLEAFDFSRDAREVAARSINHLKAAQSARVPINTL